MFKFLLEGETTGTATGGGNYTMLIMLGIMVVALYFLVIRPQKKRDKEEAAMRNGLQIGDEVTTIGGIIGEIVSMKEDTITIETSKAGTKIRFLKSAIRSVDVRAEEKNAPAEETETDAK